ncbi:CHRD domain-containing protein [Nocardioides sp.]|uniref:CHRD domain-containing protein n=1 Tax=Nocardioides sp. TaxID=35761 RepID=UPI002ED3721E
MTKWRHTLIAVVAGMLILGGSAASARGGGDDDVRTRLIGYEEVPAISSSGKGNFRAEISLRKQELDYRLEYSRLSTPVQQAHIHFGQFSVNGGISVFLCSNLGNGPAGTPACPDAGTVTGTLTAAQVVGPGDQGIDPGEFKELVKAIDAEIAYVNVHTDKHKGGEIRGQLD